MTNNTYWNKDLLNRQLDAEMIIRNATKIHDEGIVTGKSGLVMAINAPWGGGKSFLLDGIAEDLSKEGRLVLRFNAWENDYSKDALTSFLSEIVDQLEKATDDGDEEENSALREIKRNAGKVALDVGKVIGAGIIKKLSGVAADEIFDALTGSADKVDIGKSNGDGISFDFTKDIFSIHAAEKRNIHNLKESLNKLYQGQKSKEAPIFILVDEIDRCRPNFAIELLEAIKHIFHTFGVCFLIAINEDQLLKSIRVVYGDEFDSREYLKRFFDVDYALDASVSDNLWEAELAKYGRLADKLFIPFGGNAIHYLTDLSKSFTLTPRDIEKVCFRLYLLDGMTDATKFHIAYLAPTLFSQQKNHKIVFNDAEHKQFTKALHAERFDQSNASEICCSPSQSLKAAAALYRHYAGIQQISLSKTPSQDLSETVIKTRFNLADCNKAVERLGRISK